MTVKGNRRESRFNSVTGFFRRSTASTRDDRDSRKGGAASACPAQLPRSRHTGEVPRPVQLPPKRRSAKSGQSRTEKPAFRIGGSRLEIRSPVRTTTTHPITLYQRKAILVKK